MPKRFLCAALLPGALLCLALALNHFTLQSYYAALIIGVCSSAAVMITAFVSGSHKKTLVKAPETGVVELSGVDFGQLDWNAIRSLLSMLNEATFVLDETGEIIALNEDAAELLGVAPSGLRGHNLDSYIADRSLPQLLEAADETLLRDTAVRLRTGGGREISAHISLACISEKDARRSVFLCSVQDSGDLQSSGQHSREVLCWDGVSGRATPQPATANRLLRGNFGESKPAE